MILHVGFILRRRAEAEFFGDKPILLVEGPGVDIGLERIQPNVLRRLAPRKFQKRLADATMLVTGMNV